MPITRRQYLQQLATLALLGCGKTVARGGTRVTNVTRGPFFVDTIDDPNNNGMGGGPPPRDPFEAFRPRRPRPGRPPPDHPPGGDLGPPGGKRVDPRIAQRGDLRGGAAGVPLALTLAITDLDGAPLPGARVDLWQCSARGVYSDVKVGMNDHGADHTGETWLRGYQLADDRGRVGFTTVYPGWYQGRTVHIHFKVRQLDGRGAITTETTSQLFLPDALSDAVFAGHPAYVPGADRIRNDDDDIFAQESPALVLEPSGSIADGYRAALALAIEVGAKSGG